MAFDITFTPVYRPGVSLSVSVTGAVLNINGDAIDLSALEDGDLLPGEAAQALHPLLAYAAIERLGDTIHLTLAQPYGYTEPWAGPPVTVIADGPVALPFPGEGEPITGDAEIAVDPGTIIRAATRASEARRIEFPNLSPEQFWFALRVSGFDEDIAAWLDGMDDPVARASASAKLEYATFFERDHPLIVDFCNTMGVSPEEVDDLWRYAYES